MKSPLIPINVPSIYKDKAGEARPLPKRMALCTPDTYKAILGIAAELEERGGKLILSDLFRTFEMQASAWSHYIIGTKKAFSSPTGGSFHEAGRAFDIDLAAIKIPLEEFWLLSASFGVTPIIKQPDPQLSEAWHFECRGSHQLVYDYYHNREYQMDCPPYVAAASSAILSVGINNGRFGSEQIRPAIQSCLIRLGEDVGNIDGWVGKKTKAALQKFGWRYKPEGAETLLFALEILMQKKFPGEYNLDQD